MPVERELWSKADFAPNAAPPWPCPHCNKSTIHPVKETMACETNAEASAYMREEGYDPDMWEGHFACLFKCTHGGCVEAVACLGAATDCLYNDHDGPRCDRSYHPKYFYPALPLFPIPAKCPASVRDELRLAFAVFWSDLASLVTHSRIAVENMLTEFGIKRRKMVLHDRISKLKLKYPQIANRLLAAKYIGNAGPHSGSVTQDDAFDLLDLLEDAIHEIFEKRSATLDKMSANIIRHKKPQSTHPSRKKKSKKAALP
jgi:hypothetical protein